MYPSSEVKPPDKIEQLASRIPIAEDIARFRLEIEQKVLEDKLPRLEWLGFSHDAFRRYPRIKDYEKLIGIAIMNARSAKDSLDSAWRSFGESENSDEATPEGVENMCSQLLKIKPTGEVTVSRGTFTLNFLLGHEDYLKSQQSMGTGSSSAAHSIMTNGMMVHVYDRDFWMDLIDVPIVHESEHSKNRIIIDSFKEAGDRLVLGGEMERGIGRLNQSMYIGTQNEIIAQFAPIRFVRKKTIEDFKAYITKNLTGPEGYISDALRTEAEKVGVEDYSKKLREGINALFDMYSLYQEIGEHYPDRMAINVLMQFPLENWPAVFRLFYGRHKKADTSGS